MRINQLPAAVANQIAAGEVIERPASVVKELLENSFDAGANHILIEISHGGFNRIKISDNGSGIVEGDLPLAVAAHATSKISTLNDLYTIGSMGFRGEALASITSIAKVTISSKPAHQEHAAQLSMMEGDIRTSLCARSNGTTVDVVDLFYNAPVRKRFLKSEAIEFQAIVGIVKRFAMSLPSISLSLIHNGKTVLNLPAAQNERAKWVRLTKLFGHSFIKEAIYLEVVRAGMALSGWISGKQYQRSQSDRQWVYINQRMVKDKLIQHALKQVYDGVLHPGRFPACLLYLTIDSSEVDVNVHPTKHEVRFQQPRLVHDFFISQLQEALGSRSTESAQKVIEYALPTQARVSLDIAEPGLERSSPAMKFMSTHLSRETEAWVVLNARYALIFKERQPYLVDVPKLYGVWLQRGLAMQSLPLCSRPLLVPVTLAMDSVVAHQVITLQEELKQFGLIVQLNKGTGLLIRTIPVCAPYLDVHHFFNSLSLLHAINFEALKQLFYQSQMINAYLLNDEERSALYHECCSASDHQPICRILTTEDCERLFNA